MCFKNYFLFVRTLTFSTLLVFSYNLADEGNEEIAFPIDQFIFNTEKYDDNIDIFKICDEVLGCIETDARWYHKQYRPVNLRPLPRHILKTDFLLIKKHNSNINELLYSNLLPKESAIKESEFRNDSDLMILIHDFTANGYTGWIKHLAKTIFIHSIDANLISVDWQRGAEPPYDQAVANARIVALETIGLVKELREKCNYSLSNIHIIGHGIGAHIAGYVGATYNKIKKITGLDPSGPRFQGMPDLVKLNPRCAKYVEDRLFTKRQHLLLGLYAPPDNELHFQARSQGINETLGHSDFFVNGARKQPGCPENTTFDNVLFLERTSLKQGEILPSCSHKRAFKYFVESLVNQNCHFQGIKCGSLTDFENGKCTHCNISDHDCRVFGLRTYADISEGNHFFLNTAARYPYCLLEYRIGVHIKDEEKSGYFDFILVDENGNVAEAATSIEEKSHRIFKSGADNNNTFVYFASPPYLKNVKEAKVKWTEEKKIYCFIFCHLSINVEKISVAFLGTGNDDQSEEIFFCPREDRVQIESGSYVTFRRCSEKTEPYNTPLDSVNETLTNSNTQYKNNTPATTHKTTTVKSSFTVVRKTTNSTTLRKL